MTLARNSAWSAAVVLLAMLAAATHVHPATSEPDAPGWHAAGAASYGGCASCLTQHARGAIALTCVGHAIDLVVVVVNPAADTNLPDDALTRPAASRAPPAST